MKTILAIETSCDETGVAIIRGNGHALPHFTVLVNLLATQIQLHKKYGGVVPNLAAREHEKNLPILLARALRQARRKNITIDDIDVVAVTKGPGLSPALWRGINFAKDFAEKNNKPLLGVDHMRGHIIANFLEAKNKIAFPALALVVSGGHTELVLLKKLGQYVLLGETVDDAAGEAFDKVARMIGLPYPGGPEINKLAQKGDPRAFPFPRPMLAQRNYDFSFSGLKTAVLYTLRDLPTGQAGLPAKPTLKIKRNIAASFEQAVVDVLVAKTLRAAKEYNVKTVMLAGGVSANKKLRDTLRDNLHEQFPKIYFHAPSPALCTDNAAMIGAAAYVQLISSNKKPARIPGIQAEPSRKITDN